MHSPSRKAQSAGDVVGPPQLRIARSSDRHLVKLSA